MSRGSLYKPRVRALEWRALRRVVGTCVLVSAGACVRTVVNVQAPSAAAVPVREDARRDLGLSIWDGVFTSGQASRGDRRFQQVCASCHRVSEFSGALFRRGWADQSVRDLFDLIVTTMPDGNPGSLRSDDYADIVAFILQSNDYPAGEVELPPDLFQLENIRIIPAPE